jgi:hypothetical protein
VRPLLLVLALVGAAPHTRAAEPEIGRLFFTPAERAALETARKHNINAEQLAAEASKKPAAPKPQDVTVSGVVMRSDGQSFAWVNGKSVEGQTGDGLRVRHTAQPNKVVVYDPDKGRMVQVKVGQRADLLTGHVEEVYERRKRAAAEEAAAPETELEALPAPPKRTPRTGGVRERNAKADVAGEPGAVPADPEKR